MKIKLVLFLVTISHMCLSQNSEKVWPSISMVNDVIFKDSTYNHRNIGCGFLLSYNNETYAITAKHLLQVAHTDKMKTTHFENELKKWVMYPKDKKEQTVILGNLLNEDRTDSLNWDNYNNNFYSYTDWLIFDIKANNSDIKPVELSKHAPVIGDTVYVVGWTYDDTVGNQRVYSYMIKGREGQRLKMSLINAPESGAGLSGSPVLNSEGYLVGIISSGGYDPEFQQLISKPCTTDYLIRFFENLADK